MKKKILNLYFHYEDKNYGLKFLIEFDEFFLVFNSINFELVQKHTLKDWNKVNYTKLSSNDIFIEEVKEDELISYFIRLSNKDIIYIYQKIDGLENWHQNFKIVEYNSQEYKKVYEYMNEDWIENVKYDNI